MVRDLYEMKEQPPVGEVPQKMYAWTVRPERYGEPEKAWQLEVVDVPEVGEHDVLVYVMAAGVNYNNVWAGLGVPVDVIGSRNKAGEPENFHIGGSDASGIVYKVGSKVQNVQIGDEVVLHCGHWDPECPHVLAGGDPMYSPSFRIWGYETNYGSFAQFTRVRAEQCLPKPTHLTWEEAAAYMLVGATAYRMLLGWGEHAVRKDDVVLVWGGAGGLGSMAIQIARAKGAIPIAVVSSDSKTEYCKSLGAKGAINRKNFDHWGMLPHWKDEVGYSRWLKGVRNFGRAIWDILGERRNPRIVFEHPGESTIPTSMFVCDTGGMVVICAGTTGYNATVDLRYLWMRQKNLQGSHFANTEQSAGLNQLVAEGLVDPCLSRTFVNEELPTAHQLMFENKHPHGNMAVLIGAPEMGMGISASLQKERLAVEVDDSVPEEFYIPPHREIVEPTASIRPEDELTVGEVMRPDVVTCTSEISIRKAAKMLDEHDVQGMVVTDAEGWAVGVVSQTDVVLAVQGRPDQAMDSLTVEDIMTPRLLSCRPSTRVSDAITTMTRMKVHRLVVVEKHGDKLKPVGLMSMRAIVRKLAGVPQPGEEG
ncbi:MAG: crotonyl-CoA carboxylase/reductase [Myxococcales bacterium]|nr:crotonyl-CoA carboxylase/reductase [Myxococcales bacterium]